MDYFPIFMATKGRRVLFIGGGEDIGHKLLLLGKSSAERHVFGAVTDTRVPAMIADGHVIHHGREVSTEDTADAAMAYIGTDDDAERDRAMALLDSASVPYCVIDDRARSRFITPAIVDRDPVVVAIGTEGTAPVLARMLKAKIDALMPPLLGTLARLATGLRPKVEKLPKGSARRQVWSRFFAAAEGADAATLEDHLDTLITETLAGKAAEVHPVRFVSAGPGDPDLLTRAAAKALDDADVVLHDRLVPQAILELCRREAFLIETGKKGFGPGWSQEKINALLIEKAQEGGRVVRLKSGDAGLFGRLDEEIAALDAAGISHDVIPGVTAAAAAAASMGVSLTRRGRNSTLTLITGHDMKGFAEQDWRKLSRSGAVTAVYMGLKALPFVQGRLLMHGASPEMPVTLAESVGTPDRKNIFGTLGEISQLAKAHKINGPVVIMLGLKPHAADAAIIPDSDAHQRKEAVS